MGSPMGTDPGPGLLQLKDRVPSSGLLPCTYGMVPEVDCHGFDIPWPSILPFDI